MMMMKKERCWRLRLRLRRRSEKPRTMEAGKIDRQNHDIQTGRMTKSRKNQSQKTKQSSQAEGRVVKEPTQSRSSENCSANPHKEPHSTTLGISLGELILSSETYLPLATTTKKKKKQHQVRSLETRRNFDHPPIHNETKKSGKRARQSRPKNHKKTHSKNLLDS
jgi:hypothetical protein